MTEQVAGLKAVITGVPIRYPRLGYNITGIRIPTVVVSPYSRPNAVSNVPHDQTSIIATITAKWNLPATHVP